MKLRTTRILAVTFAAVVITGCRQDKVTFTDVPKERGAEPLAIQVPEGWEPAPRGEFRIHSFIVRGSSNAQAEVSVIPLPNLGGKLLDNINRWRSSIGLEALNEEDLAKQAKPVKVGHESGSFFEMNGDSTEKDEPTRILGAIVNIEGSGWYFKMMGDDKLVTAQKPEFMKFLAGYKFPPHKHDHDDHAGHNHAENPHEGAAAQDPHAGLNISAAPPTPESGPPQKAWPAPPSWQQQAPGMMQDAKFSVAGGKATATVSQAGGAMVPNIQRWRGQLQMAQASDAEVAKAATALDLNGIKATLVDLSGPSQRMIVVIVPKGETSVFYKLMGESAAVAAEKDALIEFARRVK